MYLPSSLSPVDSTSKCSSDEELSKEPSKEVSTPKSSKPFVPNSQVGKPTQSFNPNHTKLVDKDGNELTITIIDDKVYPAVFSAQLLYDIKQFQARDDDIWIVSYPKAGTHWVHEMLHMLLQQKAEYDPLDKEHYMLEFNTRLPTIHFLSNLKGRRLINTHLAPEDLPAQLMTSQAKVIYMWRNPLDTLVSMYYHMVGMPALDYNGQMDTFIELCTETRFLPFGGQLDHMKKWSRFWQRQPDRLFYGSYEANLQDTTGSLQQLADFLDVTWNPQLLADICSACSLEKMKEARVRINSTRIDTAHDSLIRVAFRKGQVGDWKNHLNSKQVHRIRCEADEALPGIAFPVHFIYE